MECFLDLKSKKELYSGVGPVMFSLAVSNFIFFYSHEAVKSMIINQKVKNAVIGAGKALLASTMAGAINVLLTNPLWVATLRIQLAGNENQENIGSRSQVKSGLFAMMTKIVKEEGILKLWSGTLTSLVLCSNPAIQLAFYERCKRNLLNIKRIKNQAISTDMVSLNLVEAFFIGAVAKALATVITYPLQLAQVLLRLQRSQRKTRKKTGIENNLEEDCREQYKSTIDCIRKLWNRGGIVELYSGLNAKLLQTILTSAFMFLTYEQTLSIFKKAAIAFMTKKKRSKPF